MGLGVQVLFILTGLLFAALCISVSDALRQIRRRRRAEDTATSRIRSAAQGYVELQGRLVTPTGEPQVTRFAKQKCVWWRYQVRAYEDDRWRVIEQWQSQGPWVLEDDTGRCLLDPQDAGLIPPRQRSPKFSGVLQSKSGPMPDARVPAAMAAIQERMPRWLRPSATALLSPSYAEEWIPYGTEAHVHGLFQTRALDDDDAAARLLAEWQRRDAGLLDRNRDGALDLREYEAGYRAALAQGRRVNQQRGGPAQVHWLTKPADGRPFKSHFGHESGLVSRSWLSARAFPWVLVAFVVTASLFFWLALGR